MSAPVLTISEQRAAISKKKKKKKALKNVLGIPDNLKTECRFVEINEVAKLNEILKRLLPAARLPLQQKKKSNKDSTEPTIADSKLRENTKNKRDQLSLGINALNKSLKKNLISAVLLANDIQPKFLISHLNLLCMYSRVPFLHVPGLRETTKVSLGFPCVAVGFKADTHDFAEAVEEIKSLFETKKFILQNEKQEIETDSSEYNEVEKPSDKISSQGDETPFTHLYRSSVKERAFIPEKDGNELARRRTESDFISVEKDTKEITDLQKQTSQKGISSNLTRKPPIKTKKLQEFIGESDSDEELEVPKKKAKKDWVIDKKGTKQNCKYYPAKLFKIPSNSNRNCKKHK